MISKKTAAILLFITLNMQCVASTLSRDTKRRRPSTKPIPTKRQKCPFEARGTVQMLVDTTNVVSPVEVQGRSGRELGTLQELASGTEINSVLKDENNTVNDVIPGNNQVMPRVSVCQRLSPWIAGTVIEEFKRFMEEGSYMMARCLAITMDDDALLKLACSTVKTIEQYNGILSHLKSHNMGASFYVYGNIEVVKAVIAESRPYVINEYVKNGDLETALPLALEKDRHDRFIELLAVRKGVTTVMEDRSIRFGYFVLRFLENLAPWEDGMALRRFLILHGEELRNEYRGIFDTFCETLAGYLSSRLHLPKAKILLVDLIGQPLLLTPVIFARGFLNCANDLHRSAFIKHGWRETIQEGLKTEYRSGGKELWVTMQKARPDQFSGEFPDTEEARIAACMHFPTKQQKEEEWIKKYFTILFNQLNNLDFLPTVLWSIISEYAVLFIAIMD